MDQDILKAILKDTFTQIQLKARLHILKSYLTQKLFEAQKTAFEPQDINWLNSRDSTFYQKFTRENVYQLLSSLQTQVNQMTSLIIYLPFEANDEVLSQIGSFSRTTFGKPDLIFEAKFDPKLIAGCALSWKGIYKDYSLKAQIEERKAEVLESFKKFLR